MMINKLSLLILFMLSATFIVIAQEDETELSWPREIETENKTIITFYQPQLESFENNVLIGRMAVSVNPAEKELTFGALWFSAYLTTDLENRIALLDELKITQTHFPEIEEDKVEAFARALEESIAGSDIEMSLDRLLVSLELAEVYQEQSTNLNNNPPDIYFRTEPAILVYIDGEPFMQDSEVSGIEYVANTPYFLVKYDKTGDYYLKGARWWYTSKQAASGWTSTEDVPNKVEKFAKDNIDDEGVEQDSLLMTITETPELIVSTVPAELVSTDGEPKYTPLEGTSLLYVENSENDIIMDINSQKHYILLAGRWYTSRSLQDGDWTFAEPKELPAEFADIPAESPMADVLPSVPGTEEANIAVLEQTIPQTATVDRKTATVEVKYDGDPQFKAIEGTSMSYAVNCNMSVILVENIYYCVDNGIWFESANAKGPYAVSTERPEGVEDIPAESPVYNVKYVYIYDYTPELVYVGYTPGYTCSYVYGGVVVYGTGYYYRPWYGHYYYPRPVTYGFGVHYNPYTGWGFSVGISFGRHYGGYGMWGPRGYHHGYRSGYSHGYRHGYNRGYAHGARAGYNAGQRSSNRNVYSNRNNGVRSTGVSQRPARGDVSRNQGGNTGRQTQAQTRDNPGRGNLQSNTRPSTKENNVYSDRNGNVQRRDQNGSWENRSDGRWQQQQPSTRDQQTGNRQQPSTREQQNTRQQPSTRQQPATRQQNTQQMNRSHQSRQQGTQRQSNYNSSRSQSPSRSSGSRSSGGGGARRR